MLRRAVAAIAFIILIGSFAFTQETAPKVQVFGGFAVLHVDTAGLTGPVVGYALDQPPSVFGVRTWYFGWNAEGQYNASRWVGVVVDFGGRRGSPFTAQSQGITGLPDSTSYNFLAGPVISYRTKSIFTPFVHTLFGWERTSLSASTISGALAPVSSKATSVMDFTMALGGGADCRISRHISVRLAQLDWYHTSLNQNDFYTAAYGPGRFTTLGDIEHNKRISTGIVATF